MDYETLLQGLRDEEPKVNWKNENLKQAELKPFILEQVTWEQLGDVKKYTELLLYASHLRLPDGTIMFAIEWLVDQSDEFLTGVISELGFDHLQATLPQMLELVWLFYVTGLGVTLKSDLVAALTESDEDTLYKLATNMNRIMGLHRMAILFMLATQSYAILSPVDRNIKPGKKDNLKKRIQDPLDKAFAYGKSIYRAVLYLSINQVETDLQKELFNPANLGTLNYYMYHYGLYANVIPLYDLLIPSYYLENEHKDQVDGLLHNMEFLGPFVAGYHRNLSSKGADFPDNVEELAPKLGMVFPPTLPLPGDRSNYFFFHLKEYRRIWKPDRTTSIWGLTDAEILKVLGVTGQEKPVITWNNRTELVQTLLKAAKLKDDIPFGAYLILDGSKLIINLPG